MCDCIQRRQMVRSTAISIKVVFAKLAKTKPNDSLQQRRIVRLDEQILVDSPVRLSVLHDKDRGLSVGSRSVILLSPSNQ
jgi:hypothetical protein